MGITSTLAITLGGQIIYGISFLLDTKNISILCVDYNGV